MWLNENRGTDPMRLILIALAFAGLSACIVIGDAGAPIATETIAAPRPSAERTLVIVLPGFGADASEMKERGVAASIQEAWPEADVMLASATFDYYRKGKLAQRLHDEVVGVALKRGYKKIWLAGASLGGMGALLYEQQHPGTVTGIVLFAPFLGDRALMQEIDAAGGPRAWNPGELAADVNADNYQRHVWKMVKAWAERPELARRVWLACGVDDRLMRSARLMSSALPQDRFIELPGGHTWAAWLNGGKTVFSRIRSES
jgi:triacylglycerol esterase/lipase EstA (alpha/beta hydrolase family)